jgi:ATP-dependent RNA helicase DBP3
MKFLSKLIHNFIETFKSSKFEFQFHQSNQISMKGKKLKNDNHPKSIQKITKNNKTKPKNPNIQISKENLQNIEKKNSEPPTSFDIKKIDKSSTHVEENIISDFLKSNEVTISGEEKFTPTLTFPSTNFPTEMLQKLTTLYEYPTPIQALAWSVIMKNLNVVSIAKTGSGKTLAFVLPAILHSMNQIQIKKDQGPFVSLFIIDIRGFGLDSYSGTRSTNFK